MDPLTTGSTPGGTGLAALRVVVASHRRLLGSELGGPPAVDDPRGQLRWLDEVAPFGLLAHDGAPDPCFTYANATAARWFGYDRADVVGTPSRRSAGEEEQDDRDALLAAVAARGFATGYRGLRVERSGRHFWIEDVTMWNVVDEAGRPLGQAALLPRRVEVAPPAAPDRMRP